MNVRESFSGAKIKDMGTNKGKIRDEGHVKQAKATTVVQIMSKSAIKQEGKGWARVRQFDRADRGAVNGGGTE